MAEKVTRSDEKKSIFGLEVNGPVFFSSSIIIIASIILTLIYEKQSEKVFENVQNYIANNGGWFFVLVVNIFLGFMIYLAFSKFGVIW